jgi:phosphate transport system substrate-binding protein
MTKCLNPARAGFLGAALALSLLPFQAAPARADEVKLAETGSTLLYPLFSVWVPDYLKSHSGVQITTGATGSGAGIDQALAGTVQIGASDAYMSDAQIKQNPQIVNIPVAISAQTVNYNLPDLNGTVLKLDGPTLAAIYSGKIRRWNDKAITDMNPGVTLPDHDIVPVRRAESSGDTFVFTQFLTFSTPSWEDNQGFGTTVAWPDVSGSLTATGNQGMVQTIQQTPYSIGYIGISFFGDIAKAGLGTATLKSYSGEFLLPTPETIKAAAASLGPRTPADERLTLVFAPGENAYPLINYEYAVVSTKQANPETAAALRKFLLWATAPDEANDAYLSSVHFISVPAHTWELDYNQIQTIK